MIRIQILVALALLSCADFSDAGVTYVRWGRTVCPTGAHLLYKGYMVGPHYAGKGSSGNHLCAPETPTFERGTAGYQDWAGQMFGVEFEENAPFKGLFLKDNLPNGVLHNQDMVCAVCYVADSTTSVVIPARKDCMGTGFDLQYKGYLVSEANWGDRSRSDVLCMDEVPEGRVGGTGDDNQSVVYPVQFGCGSLPCNPYVDNMEIACAVCTY